VTDDATDFRPITVSDILYLMPPEPEPPKPPSPKEMAQLLFAYATARMVSFMAVAGMTSSDQRVPVQNKRLRGWGA
jgi:hypothetical protein